MTRSRTYAVVLFLSFGLAMAALVGCGKKPADKLAGTWKATAYAAEDSENEEAAQMAEMMGEAEIVMEFKEDGTFTRTMSMGERSQSSSGTWEVTGSEGDNITVKTVEGEGDEAEEETVTVTFTDGDTFTFTRDGITVTMARQAAE